MKNELEYKGYKANIEFSAEDDLLVGQVCDVDALILFSASSVDEVKDEFRRAVDAYLEECRALGLTPEKAYKGSFNVRVGREAHRKAALMAKQWKVSLNEFVRIAIEQVVDRKAILTQPLHAVSTAIPAPPVAPYFQRDVLVEGLKVARGAYDKPH